MTNKNENHTIIMVAGEPVYVPKIAPKPVKKGEVLHLEFAESRKKALNLLNQFTDAAKELSSHTDNFPFGLPAVNFINGLSEWKNTLINIDQPPIFGQFLMLV